MSKPDVRNFIRKTKTTVSKHSPEILTGFGISGMVITTVLAVRATPKALELIEQAKQSEDEELNPVDVVKVAWKPYIPAAVTGSVSIACLIGASSQHVRRNAALAMAYNLSETALVEYKEKVLETIGEKKEKVVREKVAEEKLKRNPVSKNEVIITGKGSTLCYDDLGGRYFECMIDDIDKAFNKINNKMMSQGYVSLNDFYYELNLSGTTIGKNVGWKWNGEMLEPDNYPLIADDGRPCIAIGFSIDPDYGFDKFM